MTTGGMLTEGTAGPGKTSALRPFSAGIFTVGRGQMDDFLRRPLARQAPQERRSATSFTLTRLLLWPRAGQELPVWTSELCILGFVTQFLCYFTMPPSLDRDIA